MSKQGRRGVKVLAEACEVVPDVLQVMVLLSVSKSRGGVGKGVMLCWLR